MPTVIVDIPDQGLVTRFGVTMPVGETEFHMDKIPGGARADAAYTITYKHGDHVRVHHCHFGVEYISSARQLIYYFQQEGGRRCKNDLWECWEDKALRSCMAELGADYWNKFCIMASLGIFKGSEDD